MKDSVFSEFRELIHISSGIALTDEKKHLLSNRIFKRLRALELSDPNDYLNVVKSDSTGQELCHLIDAISTNVTHFFREAEQFDALSEIVKDSKG